MEYVAMLSEPNLVAGLATLLQDDDVAVVKRTARVFTNVYRHALHFVSTGELDKETFLAAWPVVKEVRNVIFELLGGGENEGTTVHAVRFLEAALVAHLLADVSRYPDLDKEGQEVVQLGIKALVDHVTTPYVGGSSYIVGVKSLITVACYKVDIRQKVTDLIEKQIRSPPPTLFDHNVRSFKKILQRNLYRLLRRAEEVTARRQLVEMMVSVGIPRKMLAQWAPAPEAKKRANLLNPDEDVITGRNTPPTKRRRTERSSQDGESSAANTPPGSGRTTPDEARQGTSKDQTNNPPSRCSTPPTTPDILNNLELLKDILDSTTVKPFKERCSEEEGILYDRLELKQVVELFIAFSGDLPDFLPKDFEKKLSEYGEPTEDVTTLRERLSSMLTKELSHKDINILTRDTLPEEYKSRFPIQNPSSAAGNMGPMRSSPSPPHNNGDVDLRQKPGGELAGRAPTTFFNSSRGDTDMRTVDPRTKSRDPREVSEQIRIPGKDADVENGQNSPKEGKETDSKNSVRGLVNGIDSEDTSNKKGLVNGICLNEGGIVGNVDRVKKMDHMERVNGQNRMNAVDKMNIMNNDRRNYMERMGNMKRVNINNLEQMNCMDQMNNMDWINGLDRMNNMDRGNNMDRMNNMDQMSRMNNMDWMNNMDRMNNASRMNNMGRMNNVDQMNMDRMNRMNNMDRMNCMDRMNGMDRMNSMERMNCMDRMNGVEQMNNMDLVNDRDRMNNMDQIHMERMNMERINNMDRMNMDGMNMNRNMNGMHMNGVDRFGNGMDNMDSMNNGHNMDRLNGMGMMNNMDQMNNGNQMNGMGMMGNGMNRGFNRSGPNSDCRRFSNMGNNEMGMGMGSGNQSEFSNYLKSIGQQPNSRLGAPLQQQRQSFMGKGCRMRQEPRDSGSPMWTRPNLPHRGMVPQQGFDFMGRTPINL